VLRDFSLVLRIRSPADGGQSAPVDVLSGALVVSKALRLSLKFLDVPDLIIPLTIPFSSARMRKS